MNGETNGNKEPLRKVSIYSDECYQSATVKAKFVKEILEFINVDELIAHNQNAMAAA